MNLNNVLRYGKDFLKSNNIDSFSIDAEVLLMYVLNFTKVQLFINNDISINDLQLKEYNNLLQNRILNIPVQYLIGHCEFMSLDFNVNKYTLIPRPDTEILVQEVIKSIEKNDFNNILEIGTGSGAISISIAHYCTNTLITATDISEKALDKAKENSILNDVSDRINFLNSDIYSNIPLKLYDAIVSNPPYIKTNDIKALSPQVRDYEPFSALDGGDDGLKFYREITSNSKKYLKKNGMLFFEIGYNQAEALKEIFDKNNFKGVHVVKDLAGLDRVVYATL